MLIKCPRCKSEKFNIMNHYHIFDIDCKDCGIRFWGYTNQYSTTLICNFGHEPFEEITCKKCGSKDLTISTDKENPLFEIGCVKKCDWTRKVNKSGIVNPPFLFDKKSGKYPLDEEEAHVFFNYKDNRYERRKRILKEVERKEAERKKLQKG